MILSQFHCDQIISEIPFPCRFSGSFKTFKAKHSGWIVPLFFLALLFLTGSNKVIFLILWIVSLFALSIYLIVVEYMDYNLQEKIMELKGEEGDLKAVTPTDFDRAAQIIRETRKLIGEGLNSPAETGTEEDPEDETEEENEDETEDWEDGE